MSAKDVIGCDIKHDYRERHGSAMRDVAVGYYADRAEDLYRRSAAFFAPAGLLDRLS